MYKQYVGISGIPLIFLQNPTESLKKIGLTLFNAVKAGKAIQIVEEAGKVVLKQTGEYFFGLST